MIDDLIAFDSTQRMYQTLSMQIFLFVLQSILSTILYKAILLWRSIHYTCTRLHQQCNYNGANIVHIYIAIHTCNAIVYCIICATCIATHTNV